MILNITHNNQTIAIHCSNFCQFHYHNEFYGIGEEAKKALADLGVTFKSPMEKTITVSRQNMKNIHLEKAAPRTAYMVKVSDLAIGEHYYDNGRYLIYEGGNKGYYMPSWGKEIVERSPKHLVQPCTDIPTKEIKVRLYRIERDHCIEHWQSESIRGKRYYFGRDTADGHWCVLSDAPGGWCEPSHSTGPHYHFIVCDRQWNELFRDANNHYLFPEKYPTLEKVCKSEWESVKDKYPDIQSDGVQAWLDTFRPAKLDHFDSINWDHNRYKNIDPDNILEDSHMVTHEPDGDFKTEILHTFLWLNEPYHIIRYAHKHNMCDARWYVYMVVSVEKGKVSDNIHWLAYQLDVKPSQPNT